MNLYLWCYVVTLTECNNRHKYYHVNPHNSEFMHIFCRLSHMDAVAVNLDYFTDLFEINI